MFKHKHTGKKYHIRNLGNLTVTMVEPFSIQEIYEARTVFDRDYEAVPDEPEDSIYAPAEAPAHDPVSNPKHYTTGGIETIDFIDAKQLGFNLGNVVKYVTRADHKGKPIEDLKKAQWYLEREIYKREQERDR